MRKGRMPTHRIEHQVKTHGDGDIIDLSQPAADAVSDSRVRDGICTIFAVGSTSAITTIEFEPGLKVDLPRILNQIAPRGDEYEHDKTWGDGNGFSHIRASLIGPSITVPVADGHLMLGQWQQPVLIECDNRPRQRTILITVLGE